MRFSSRVPFELDPNSWAARLGALRAAGAELIDLTEANPARTGLSPDTPARDAAWSESDLARYEPDARGAAPARAAVAEYHSRRGAAIDAGDIVLTASTSEAYAHAFRMLADPGEAFLVPRPGYPLFVPLARAEGIAIQTYRLAWDGRWHVDWDDLERAMGPRVRAIVAVQPNHPTGSCLEPEEIERLDAFAARHGVAVVSDEVFGDFGWPCGYRGAGARFLAPGDAATPIGEEAPSLPSFAGPRAALTLVLSGLSKVCGLPQMKLGWIALAGPAPERAAALRRLEWIADLFLSPSAPAQLAAPRWLAGRMAFQTRVRERIARNLARLALARRRAPALTPLPADGGWVAIVRLPDFRDGEQWSLALLELGVIVHPGHFYDLDSSAVVVSLIADPERFDRGVARLEALASER